jgi:hypothetical protein
VSFARVFLLRAAGVVLVASAVAVLLLRERWGVGSIPTLSWAALWAWVMGWIGFRSLAQAMTCPPARLMTVVVLGMMQRVLILGASQAVVFFAYDDEWGRRALLSTVLLYLLVLGVEVFTLNQSLRAGGWKNTAGAPGEAAEDSTNRDSSDQDSTTRGDTAE